METSARSQLHVPAAHGAGGQPRTGLASIPQAPPPAGGDCAEPSALRVAIIDRDSGFLMVLAKRMERAGWTHRVLSGKVSNRTLAAIDVDALIVDVAMLGAQRWKWLARLCERRPDLRVVICTGSSSVAERVCALRLGADDWLSKPCHPEELIARIEAVTAHRRRPELRDLEPLRIGEVEIRPDLYQAFVNGSSLRLTRREYQLIELLGRGEGEVQPREEIYECLWGYTMARNDRSVDVFVHKLRRKLEVASPHWRYIHTHFGVGYRLAAELTELIDGSDSHESELAQELAAQPLAA
jgi:DNA-binding response OmpR family regulator